MARRFRAANHLIPFYYLGFVPAAAPAHLPAKLRARDVAETRSGAQPANSWPSLLANAEHLNVWAGESNKCQRGPTSVVEEVEDGNPYRVGIVLSLVKAIADGDEATVREWFKTANGCPDLAVESSA